MNQPFSRRGRLASSYPAAVCLVICALVPYLLLSAAVLPLAPALTKTLRLSKPTFDMAVSLSTAAYAVGTVLAVQLAVRRPQRRMLLVYCVLFLAGSVLAASAPDPEIFVVGFILQGLCTSLMLIAAVPPLVTGWPVAKLPITAVVMNLCIFGAVAVGPTVGAVMATAPSWRPLFWAVAAIALAACVFAVLTFEDVPPQDGDSPLDVVAITLAVVGCGLAFFGAAELEATAMGVLPLATLFGGVACLVALVTHQYRIRNPLMPVKQLATTMPTMGILLAMSVSSGAFGLMELVLVDLQKKLPAGQVAVLFLPEFAAAVLTALFFGAIFRTRFLPVLALSGSLALAASGAVLATAGSSGHVALAVGTGLLGIGVAASVSPALFLAAFSLRSSHIQRVFALIELLRGVSAFLLAPILVYVATVAVTGPTGLAVSEWICCGLSVTGGTLAWLVFRRGRTSLQVPDLHRWQEEGKPAWYSRPLRPRARDTCRGRSRRPLPSTGGYRGDNER